MAPRSCGFRAAAAYHNILALASLVLGVALLVHAIRDLHRLSTDDYTQGERKAEERVDHLDVAEAVVLLVFGLASLLAARKRCIGVTFRVIFLVASFAVVAWLAFLLVSGVIERTRGDDAQLLAQTYAGTHNSTEAEARICEVEIAHKCHGLDDADCKGCVAGRYNTTCATYAHCADCSQLPKFASVAPAAGATGCRTLFVRVERAIFVRKLLLRGLLLFAVFVDIVLSCRFPVHVSELMVDEAPDELEVTE